MAAYAIYVRNAARARVAQVEDYAALRLALRFNAVGTWHLRVPRDSAAARLLGWESGAGGIIVTRDNAALFSGPMHKLERRWNAREDVIEASGQDDLGWLADRLALPVPGGPPYTFASHDVRTGTCSTVLHAYVNVNAGAGASAQRRVAGLTFAADTGIGATVTGRARFDNLLELLQGLALVGGIGFRIVQSGTDLEFGCYAPADLTDAVRFSPELGTLEAFQYAQESAEANYIYVGGGGEGTARTFVEGGGALSIATYGRIEAFRDRRDTTDPTELAQTLQEELGEKADRAELRLSPIDTAAMRYGADYGLGDQVTAVIDGVVLTDLIREVQIDLTADRGEVVTPVIGTPGLAVANVPAIFRRQAQTSARVSNLERS
jgi:hypothetical protein